MSLSEATVDGPQGRLKAPLVCWHAIDSIKPLKLHGPRLADPFAAFALACLLSDKLAQTGVDPAASWV